ncbi:MAG: hypothetical protein R3Y33_02205 [Clostridia bacterium]
MFDSFLEALGLDDLFAGDDEVQDDSLSADLGDELGASQEVDSWYTEGIVYELGTEQLGNPDGEIVDLDGDGLYDAIITSDSFDTNNDGVDDTYVTEYAIDTDGDNMVDYVQTDTTVHYDDDNVAEYFHSEIETDTDNDGIADYFITADDYDGDGIFETVEEFEYDNSDIIDTEEDSLIIGDPDSAIDDWHLQETDSSCAVAAQEFVLEELTGQEFDESDLRDIAEANGWWSLDGGTPTNDVGNILEYMGLNVQSSTGGTIDDIAECLENDGEVIVGVDSEELWYGEDNDLWGPGSGADHAVQVVGIDYSDPDQTMVIINDSGNPNGQGRAITLELFEEAWEDSDNLMVEAYV